MRSGTERAIFDRHCEKCEKETPHRLQASSWMRMRAICINQEIVYEIDKRPAIEECGQVHIFTLTHLQIGSENREPFTRTDLGVVLKDE